MSQPNDPYQPQQGNSYAQQAGQPHDPYTAQPDPQAPAEDQPTQVYGQSDPYSGGQYGGGQYGGGYAQGSQQADPYGGQQADPYGSQPADPYGSQQADPYGGQANPYGGQAPAGSGQYAGQYDASGQYAAAGAYGAGAAGGGGQPPIGGSPYGQGSPYGSGPQGPGGSSQKNGIGLAAMIFGLVGILIWVSGIVGIILGFIGLGNVKKGLANNRGQALTGVIAGAITTVLGILGTIAIIVAVVALGNSAKDKCNDLSGYEWKDGSCTYVGSSALPTEDGGAPTPGQGEDGSGDGTDEGGDDSAAEAAAGEPAELTDGVTVAMSAKSDKAKDTASPEKARGKEIAMIKVTIKNTTGSSFTPPFPLGKATYGSKEATQVFTVIDDGTVTTTSNFTKSVPADGSRSFYVAYLVPKAQLKDLVIEYSFRLDSGDSKKLTFSFS